jgi:flagellar motor switch protein FliN/FliY
MSTPQEIAEAAAKLAAEQAAMQPEESTAASSHGGMAPLLMDVKLPIRVLMGRTQLCLRDIAQLGSGSVVELDCSPNDYVEIVVNGRVIAQGEIVVVAGNYGVRITQIAGPPDAADQPRHDLLNLSEKLK